MKKYKVLDKDGNVVSNLHCSEKSKEKLEKAMEGFTIVPAEKEAIHDDR